MANLQLTFRLARPNDFDEVMELSEGIYDGHDYLPFRYYTWMEMDELAVMLAYYGEKLVGLIARSIVDEGRTAIRRAGRTLKEFRRQGVFNQLSQAMDDFIRRQYPSVRRVRFTSLKSLSAKTKLVQLETLEYHVTKKETLRSDHFSTTLNSIEIKACTKKYLCDFIFSSPQAKKLFPNHVIIPEFFPMEPLPILSQFVLQKRKPTLKEVRN